MNFNKSQNLFSENNILSKTNNSVEKIGKQESSNRLLPIKIFQDVDFDDKFPKTQTFKNDIFNIQNLSKRIYEVK